MAIHTFPGGARPDAAHAPAPAAKAGSGFGVYVHWPFCLSKCPYCDFNSHVRTAPVDEGKFVAAIAAEIAHRAALAPGRIVDSVFFGGGTPSLMQPSSVAGILEAVSAHWSLARDAEITLEANPTSVEAERFAGYRAAGVNRVSLGVQSLINADLKMLGRLHSAEEALAAVRIAAQHFERYSFDLIYARPGQSLDDWRKELAQALAHHGGHLSLYQLTIEPDTMFERLYNAGKLAMPDAELARGFWDVTQEMMEAAGLPAYEVSNHARAGEESQHNLVYWRYGEYAGVGPGAHGRLQNGRLQDGRLQNAQGRIAQSTEKHPESWMAMVQADGHGVISQETLSAEEQGDEFLLMGLRLREGIDPARFAAIRGAPLDEARIADLLEHEMIERTADGRIRVTPDGMAVLDSVVADLAA